MPLASVGVGILDLAIALVVPVGLMGYYGLAPGMAVWTLPFTTPVACSTSIVSERWRALQRTDVGSVSP